MAKSSFNDRVKKMIEQVEETAELKDGRLTVDLTKVDGYAEADESLKEGREFRNDLTVAVGKVLLDKSKTKFEEDEDVEQVSNVIPLGGVEHTLRAHRTFQAQNEAGEDVTYNNFLSVSSDDNFGDALATLRDITSRVEESDEIEDEEAEAVE